MSVEFAEAKIGVVDEGSLSTSEGDDQSEACIYIDHSANHDRLTFRAGQHYERHGFFPTKQDDGKSFPQVT